MTQSRHVMLCIAATLAALIPAASADAQFREPGTPSFGKPTVNSDQVKLTVFTDTNDIKAHETFHLVVLFDIKDSWHLYWKNPGAGAAPIEIEVDAPVLMTVDSARWPRPKIIESELGDMYGYEDQIALFVPITPSEQFSADAFILTYDLAWAVCDDQRCLMQTKTSSITVTRTPILTGDKEEQQRRSALVGKHRARLAVDAADDDNVEISLDGSTLTVTGPAHGLEEASFVPNSTAGVQFGKATVKVTDDLFTFSAEILTKPRNFAGTKPVAGGLIALGDKPSDPSYEFSVPLSK